MIIPPLIMGITTKLLPILWFLLSLQVIASHKEQPLARIAIHKTVLALDKYAYIKATPSVLGGNVSAFFLPFIRLQLKVFYTGTQAENKIISSCLHVQIFFIGQLIKV